MADYEQARKDIMDGIQDMGTKAGKVAQDTYLFRVIHGARNALRDARVLNAGIVFVEPLPEDNTPQGETGADKSDTPVDLDKFGI